MRMHGYGDPSVLHHDEIPKPVPGRGEVLVRVAGTSFNPSEIGLRRGLLRSVLPIELPFVLGGDMSGVVVSPGLSSGARVVGRLDGGAAAEYVAAPADLLVAAPERIPLADAAALPIAGVTAWQAVFEQAEVSAGQRVLIIGAGAVGRFAVQLAKHAGAHVTVATGARDVESLRKLGADQVIGRDRLAPADVVLNFAVLGAAAAGSVQALGGMLVSATVPIGRHFVVRNDTAHLASLVGLVDAGIVRVEIAARRPLADLPAVHREAEEGRLPGKTILTPGRQHA